MSIADKLSKLQTDITNAYSSISSKGGTIPANKNTQNLASAIDTIIGGTPIYTVTFDSNGGSAVASQEIVEGYTAKEPDTPTKSGYKFSHWQLNGVEYDFDTPVTSNITLTAKWGKIYTQIQYIESTGTQYIDTGISGNGLGSLELKFNTLGKTRINFEQYFAGVKDNSTTVKIYHDVNSKSAQIARTGELCASIPIDTNDHVVQVGDNGVYVDGVKKSNYIPKAWGSISYYIFNSHGETNLASSMRLYYLKMYNNGVLVRDFIAVLDQNNVACLFDKVSETYFYNIGTGTFTAGSVV